MLPDPDSNAADVDAPTIVLRRQRSRATPRPRLATFVLAVVEGRHQGEVLRLRDGNNLVGRSLSACVRLSDSGISRRHAMLVVDPAGTIELVDLDSTNGTFVDDVRIESAVLQPGARVRMGHDAVLELRSLHDEARRSWQATRQHRAPLPDPALTLAPPPTDD